MLVLPGTWWQMGFFPRDSVNCPNICWITWITGIGEAVVLAFAIFRESRKENFGLEEIGKCLEKARAESEAGKNGEAEEKEVSRNRTGGQTGTEEEKRQDPWKMDTENGERGSGEWIKERKTEKSSSRVCGSDHGKVGERDRVLKTAAVAAGILMAVFRRPQLLFLESMACFSINGFWGLQR